jgi:hypothetical protein
MGTKNNPGKFDCYANAEPDEPMFVLLGRDPTAPFVVTFWRAMKEEMRRRGASDISDAKLQEAFFCSLDLEKWAKEHGKDMQDALVAFRAVCETMGKNPSAKQD